MRTIALVILLAGSAWGQALTEGAAMAAGSTAGAVAGKKVSDGITNIFNKVDQSAAKSATSTKKAAGALIEVGPGVPQAAAGAGSVPPPPPPRRVAARKAAPVPQPIEEPVTVAVAVRPPAPPPPPPPVVTTEDLKKVTTGMEREELLKMGQPAARITMFDDGHLVEVYRYMKRDTSLGFVTLSDGSVASVVVR
jgi:hypothetical protein